MEAEDLRNFLKLSRRKYSKPTERLSTNTLKNSRNSQKTAVKSGSATAAVSSNAVSSAMPWQLLFYQTEQRLNPWKNL